MRLKALSAVDLTMKLRALGALWPSQPVEMEVTTPIQGLRLSASAATGQALVAAPEVDAFIKLLGGREHLSAAGGWVRFASDHNRIVRYTSADLIIGTIDVTGAKSAEQALQWLEAIEGQFDVAPDLEVIATAGMSEPQHKALQLIAQANADFRTEVSRLAEALARIGREDAEERRKHNLELEKDWRSKADTNAAEHQQKLAFLEEKRQVDHAALEADRQAFTREKAEFETGEAKFVRRRMLTKLEEVLAKSESMKLSEDTQRKRTIVHSVVLGIVGVAAIVGYFMGSKYWVTGDLHYGIPMATATITLFATLVYYLRWNDRWFREHSDAEFAAKRYQADVVRANWLAELFAEQKQAGAELPPELLDAFTRNLFRGSTTLEEAEHPFEQITSLLKRAKELKIGGGQLSLSAAPREKPQGQNGAE